MSSLRVRLIESCWTWKQNVDQLQQTNIFIEDEFKTTYRMSNFTPVSNEDINDIIRSAPSKHCELDPLPTNIMKEHKDVLAYFITRIVNTSLNTGHFSEKLKEVILWPLIKNINLSPYLPITNLYQTYPIYPN